jgi:hypothetical protein
MRSLSRSLVSLGLALALGCGSESGKDGELAPAGPDGGATPMGLQPFTQVLTVDQIAIYQAVKVSLVSDGAVVTPNAPVLAKRPALLRVGTKIPARAKVNKLTADLRIKAPGQPDVVLTIGPRDITPFDEGDRYSSFSWELTAEQMAHGAEMSVEIRDPSGADPGVVRYPAEGQLSFGVAALAPKLKVKFVPIQYEADGSNRVPLMDAKTIDAYKDALYRMYPVTEVEISVREVVPWPLEVLPDGGGWSSLLDAVIETREDDLEAKRIGTETYYVGVFTPAESQAEYCKKGGCILGIAPGSTPTVGIGDGGLRTAMIVGFHSERQHGTLAQELAHSMGRLHAPCGTTTSLDRDYPYPDANIGVWGWDLTSKELVSPDDRVDFMSYCNPVWVSDYTYAKLFQRFVDVAAEETPHPPSGARAPQAMRAYHVDKDGSVRRGAAIRSRRGLGADELVLENASHRVLGKVRGTFSALSNVGGGILVTNAEIPVATRFAHLAGH